MTPARVASAFDYTGWTVVFVFGCVCVVVLSGWYVVESRGRRQPYYMFRLRGGMVVGLVYLMLVGLRRFVVHQ